MLKISNLSLLSKNFIQFLFKQINRQFTFLQASSGQIILISYCCGHKRPKCNLLAIAVVVFFKTKLCTEELIPSVLYRLCIWNTYLYTRASTKRGIRKAVVLSVSNACGSLVHQQ